MKVPELLAPAGTLAHLDYAYAYGADAVYAGMPRYGLRVRENDFDMQNLQVGINKAHGLGKKIYITANILPHNSKIKTFVKDLTPMVEMKPDALIMADPGLMMLAREAWPDMPIHLSVQANTVNFATVKFWQSMGVERIILSRELSLDEVEEIRQQCPDMELEVFVHGALCIAYSGRCLLSGYINHRDPNQGTCTNACRWKYNEVEGQEHESGDIQAVQYEDAGAGVEKGVGDIDRILVEEEGRPGEAMVMEEDEHGTYIMNSKDLRAVEHVERLVKIGIDSLKIEGRTKSINYVSRVTQSYRQAIDDAIAGREFDPALFGKLENLASRGYTDGFFKRHHTHEYQNYVQGHSKESQQKLVGEVIGYDSDAGMLEFLSKNQLLKGDQVELILPQGNRVLRVEQLQKLNGAELEKIPGGGMKFRLPVAAESLDMDNIHYGLLARFL
ncbi:MAG: tRNA 5-hydroxyuridine modification protein YegQ [Gammaproteobacteria bacterium]|nr:tRNA 5-hydroxyuridine modification protein YegQ [Gammaproteobacteria bacterium]MCP4880202.1 tRNA 5-hydroxyuridine modification protein YegQ [Gammaproteobacteria bacterium]